MGEHVNYYFCHNPKCPAHIEVSLDILSCGRMEIRNQFIGGKVRGVSRSKWASRGKVTWLCDSCSEAIDLIARQYAKEGN